jgi:metal-dependent amidase/aminoacylase/carboxypeptidase family protein
VSGDGERLRRWRHDLHAIPETGCFALLGNGELPDAGGAPLHSPDHDFNDDALETGVGYFVNLVRTALPTGSTPY